MAQKVQVNLDEFIKQVIKTESDKYFEENRVKHQADIAGRVSFIVSQAIESMGYEVKINIDYSDKK